MPHLQQVTFNLENELVHRRQYALVSSFAETDRVNGRGNIEVIKTHNAIARETVVQGFHALFHKRTFVWNTFAREYDRVQTCRVCQYDALPARYHEQVGCPVEERVVVRRQCRDRTDFKLLGELLC